MCCSPQAGAVIKVNTDGKPCASAWLGLVGPSHTFQAYKNICWYQFNLFRRNIPLFIFQLGYNLYVWYIPLKMEVVTVSLGRWKVIGRKSRLRRGERGGKKVLDHNFKVTSLAPLSEQLSKSWQWQTIRHYYMSGLSGLLHAWIYFSHGLLCTFARPRFVSVKSSQDNWSLL